MTTVSSGGVTVKTPSSVVVYNKAATRVTPSVSVNSGVYKTVTAKTVSAYSGTRRISTGTSVVLRIGSYTLLTKVSYHNYKYVTKTKVVKTLHPGGDNVPGSTCVVVTVLPPDVPLEEGLTNIDDLTCTNPAYPGQTVNETGDDLNDISGDTFAVGESVLSDSVTYLDWYSSDTVKYQVKTWTSYASYTSGKHSIKIIDGGYQKIWTGSSSTTIIVHARANWDFAYDISCSDYGFFDVIASGGTHVAEIGPGYADYGESYDAVTLTWTGTVKLQVFSANCDWAVGVWSKKSI